MGTTFSEGPIAGNLFRLFRFISALRVRAGLWIVFELSERFNLPKISQMFSWALRTTRDDAFDLKNKLALLGAAP